MGKLGNIYQSKPKCKAKTKSGYYCRKTATHHGYCKIHYLALGIFRTRDKESYKPKQIPEKERCLGFNRDGTRCKQRKQWGPYCLNHYKRLVLDKKTKKGEEK